MIYISHLMPDEELAELLKKTKAGVECIEFSIAENLDHFDETMKGYRARLQRIGNPPLTIHGPFLDLNPAAFDSLVSSATMTRFNQGYRAAADLNAKKIVFHSGMDPHVYYEEGWAERTADFFKRFLEGKSGVPVMMENVLDRNWRLLREVCRIVDRPDFKLCLDIGHAHCYSPADVREWAKELAPYVGHVHIHDNNGIRDEHLGLGKGTLPWEETLFFLPEGEGRTWTIECPDPDDVLLTVKKLRSIDRVIKHQY